MKKIIVLLYLLLLTVFSAFGQTVDRTADKNFKGRMTIGTDTNDYIPTPPSAWLQIGEDSTDKAMILPRVVDTADVITPVKGMFVFQIKDSTIYYYNKAWLPVSSGSISTFIADLIADADTVYRMNKSIKVNAFNNDSTLYNEGAVDVGFNPYYLGLTSVDKDTMGAFSFRTGLFNRSSGMLSTTLGYENYASGEYAIAMGRGNIASDRNSTAIGNFTRATGAASTAIGAYARSTGYRSIALGFGSESSDISAIAIGWNTKSSAASSVSIGEANEAMGNFSIALGYVNKAYGESSLAANESNTTWGDKCAAFGYENYIYSYAAMVVGRWNKPLVYPGQTEWVPGSPLFIIGNGAYQHRHNAYVLLNNGISTQYGIANYSEVSTGDFTDSTLVPKQYVDSLISIVSISDTALNGLTIKNDSIILGGELKQNTTINGGYDLNINTGHFRVGNPSTDIRTKMVVVLDTVGSAPNTALGSSYKSKDADLSLAYGYNGLYGVSSLVYSQQPNPTSEFTYVAGILGKFNIPESPNSFTVNSTKVPVSGITSVVQTQNGNTSYSDMAWFVGGLTQAVPAQPAFTGHIDTAYGLYLADLKGQDAISDSIRRAYGVYVKGNQVNNYFAGHTGFGINTSTAAVDINGTSSDTGADLLRVRKSYTPTGSADTNGETGSIAWDDSYIYVKTSTGWKRAALTTF